MALPNLTDKEWEQVDKLTDKQGFSLEEAIQMVKDDKAIDKGEKLFDLPPELEEGARKARRADTRKNTRKPNDDKRAILSALIDATNALPQVDKMSIENVERIFNFEYNGTLYRVVLSAPRK